MAAQHADDAQHTKRHRSAHDTTAPQTTDAMEFVEAEVRRAQSGAEIRLYQSRDVTDAFLYCKDPYPHWAPTLELWRTLSWHNNWHNVVLTMEEFFDRWGHLPYLHVHVTLPSPQYRRQWGPTLGHIPEPEYKRVALSPNKTPFDAVEDLPTPDDIHVLTLEGKGVDAFWRECTTIPGELWPRCDAVSEQHMRAKIQHAIDSHMRAIIERRLLATHVLVDDLQALPHDVATMVVAPYMLTYDRRLSPLRRSMIPPSSNTAMRHTRADSLIPQRRRVSRGQ